MPSPDWQPARTLMETSREFVLRQLVPPPNGAARVNPELYAQLCLMDYAIHATEREGREPAWEVYGDRLEQLLAKRSPPI